MKKTQIMFSVETFLFCSQLSLHQHLRTKKKKTIWICDHDRREISRTGLLTKDILWNDKGELFLLWGGLQSINTKLVSVGSLDGLSSIKRTWNMLWPLLALFSWDLMKSFTSFRGHGPSSRILRHILWLGACLVGYRAQNKNQEHNKAFGRNDLACFPRVQPTYSALLLNPHIHFHNKCGTGYEEMNMLFYNL